MSSVLGKIIADFDTSITTKISVAGTTATLLSILDDDGATIANGRYFITIDGDNSSKEHFSCTLTGTALTALKSISRKGVESSGAVREHRVGATVTMTNFAHIKFINDLLDGTTDLDGSNPLKYDADPTIVNDAEIATKKYADDLAIAGSPDMTVAVKGIAEEATEAEIDANTGAGATGGRLAVNPATLVTSKYGVKLPTTNEKAALAGTGTPSAANKYVTNDDVTATPTANKVARFNASGEMDGVVKIKKSLLAGETIAGATLPVPCYQDTSDNEWYACDANVTTKLNFTGFAITNGTDGNAIDIQMNGIVSGFTGLDEGEKYYVQDTVGTIGKDKGTYSILVGVAISATELFIMKEQGLLAIVSDNLKVSADTERIKGGDGTNDYHLKKEIVALYTGTYRIKFDAKESADTASKARIYKNDVAYGIDREPSTSYQTFSEDLYFAAGDLIQLKVSIGAIGFTIYVRNFRLYFDRVGSDGKVNTD